MLISEYRLQLHEGTLLRFLVSGVLYLESPLIRYFGASEIQPLGYTSRGIDCLPGMATGGQWTGQAEWPLAVLHL